MDIRYNSTRNNSIDYSASKCVLKGLSEDGGLFVPHNISDVSFDYNDFAGKPYAYIAKKILSAFFSEFTQEQINYSVENAYNTHNFETDDIFTLKNLGKFGYLELYRGKTLAFKDAALSIMPYLMKCAKENMKENRKTVILTATSGDTGKAALEGFKDVDGIEIIVFYPYKGVSELQLLQMLTQEGKNTHAIAVEGNFDDVQSAVKDIFTSDIFKQERIDNKYFLSSANSINISRLIPQIVYYYYAYVKAVENGSINSGDEINFVVPTGNFGNILAGYYAKKTGLPIKKLICASNDNNVLTDFFLTGKYDKNRPFKKTISPSMDILISSNLERLIYEILGKDDIKLKALMAQLSEKGKYETDINNSVFDIFYGGYATEEEIICAVRDSFDKYGYVIDTHTACGYKVYKDYFNATKDETYSVILSTASPFKFSRDVLCALDDDIKLTGIEALHRLAQKTKLTVPPSINGIENRPRRNEKVIKTDDMAGAVLSIVNDGEKECIK